MLKKAHLWEIMLHRSLKESSDSVRIHGDKIIGRWFCLHSDTGEYIWKKGFFRPNYIVDISNGIIIATEQSKNRMIGCYGISVETGILVWSSRRSGLFGRSGIFGIFFRLLDYLPFVTTDLRDAPIKVCGNEVICANGNVLDIHTGELVKQIEDIEDIEDTSMNKFYDAFYDGKLCPINKAQSLIVSTEPLENIADNKQYYNRYELKLYQFNSNLERLWEFNIKDHGYNSISYKIRIPFLYILATKEPIYREAKSKKTKAANVLERSPVNYYLLSVNLYSGVISQEMPLKANKVEYCKLEEVSNKGAVINFSNESLRYYQLDQTSRKTASIISNLSKQVTRLEDKITFPNIINIHSIKFEIADRTIVSRVAEEIIWSNKTAGNLSLEYVEGLSENCLDMKDIKKVRSFCRELANQNGGAIIEVNVVIINETKAIYTIMKFPMESGGMVYICSLAIRFNEAHFTIKLEIPEEGPVGLREKLVAETLQEESEETMEDWFKDPYNPFYKAEVLRCLADDDAWDHEFPDHPLTKVRNEMKAIINSLKLSPMLTQNEIPLARKIS